MLLIVPDPDDPVLRDAPDDGSRQEYFHRIVAAANENLAPYERVVNFALLERDFDLERGELTAKGSYRRKAVEESFAAVIDGLYQSPWVEIPADGLRLRIPRWFFRDLGRPGARPARGGRRPLRPAAGAQAPVAPRAGRAAGARRRPRLPRRG